MRLWTRYMHWLTNTWAVGKLREVYLPFNPEYTLRVMIWAIPLYPWFYRRDRKAGPRSSMNTMGALLIAGFYIMVTIQR